MQKVYQEMDIVILPSWREGLSKSLLEAAAMELPIITTDVPGCKDIITDKYSGLVVPVKNKEKLKLALKYGRNARKTISEKFTIKIINKKILGIYEEFHNPEK